jgi:type IV pilus assembly protein PilY1
MKTSHAKFSRRTMAQAMATIWLAMAVSQPVLGAPTDISDVPMAVLNSAKPNIMFILDNSGSMEWRSITGIDALAESSDNETEFYSSTYNQLWYDPEVRYLPGKNGSSFTALNIEGTSLPGSTGSTGAYPATAAINDPYLAPTGTTTDLTPICYYNGSTPPLKPVLSGGRQNCRSTSNSTYNNGPIAIRAFYYTYNGSGSLTTDSNYTRRNIIPATASYTRGAGRTDCTVSGTVATCTYNQEIANFANWWTYYRTRILTMKTTMGLAFAGLNDKYRLGFSTINDNNGNTGNTNGSNFIAIGDFDAAKKIAWYTRLYSIDPHDGTPLQRALSRVGEYYRGNSMGYSSNNSTDDPIQYSCQHNYAILSTDGFWNSNNVTLGNTDTTVPTLPAALPTGTTPMLTAGSAFPKPYYDSTSTGNSLSDVAMYYWVNDLRTSGSVATNNVSTNAADPASWQHMTTFTIGLGADGTKDYREDYLTNTTTANWYYNNLINGTDNWPTPTADTASAIDDMWHAAVNGRGQYFNAKNPTSLQRSLKKVLDDIIARSGSAAAVAVANTDVSIDNTSYASSYNSGNWSGQLSSYPIDPATGAVSTTATWTAQSQLNALTSSTRNIVTYSGSAGVQFQPSTASTATKLTATQQATLNSSTTPPGPSDSAAVLEYIRGDRTGETNGAYRTRANLLGDIVSAEPVVVTTPGFSYGDAGYSAFKTAQSVIATTTPLFVPTRVKTVFQPANDGMIHAFRASDGAENWAYIPSFLLSTTAPSQLRNLSKKEDFTHRYFVDATPVLGDVDFKNTSGSTLTANTWTSILVGGLGKGGRGYYALDVTTPTVANEATAATRVLWEFPIAGTSYGSVSVTRPVGSSTTGTLAMDINKIGYTYGKPVIVKTKAHGWVALVTSGYNNGTDTPADGTNGTGGDGHGYLFVLNARTGALLHVFDTEAGSAASPSGLAYISAYVENPQLDNTVQYVYGGDLLGNVWRFDLNNASTSSWRLQKLTALVNGSGQVQPVTTEPELATIQISGVDKRMVYVGTGQYLGAKDIPGVVGANASATQTQSMYALVDDLLLSTSSPTAHTAPIRSNMQPRSLTLSSGTCATATTATTRSTVDTSSNAAAYNANVNYTSQWGWYVDLPCTGERVNTTPVLALGTLYFTSNIPNSDPCSPGGSSWLNILDYKTGKEATPLSGSSSLGNSLASRPILVQLPSGEVKVIVRLSDATTVTKSGRGTGFTPGIRRQSWKEIKRY